jgi:hypothetical protein
MDSKKGKKGKQKTIDVSDKGLDKKKGAKSFVIQSALCFLYLDSNSSGDVYYYGGEERNSFHKWLFEKTDTAGIYYLKGVATGLYLTSDELGNIITAPKLNSAFQKWKCFTNKELESMIQNSGNNYYISINMRNKLIMASYECETMINEFILYIDPKKPEKK